MVFSKLILKTPKRKLRYKPHIDPPSGLSYTRSNDDGDKNGHDILQNAKFSYIAFQFLSFFQTLSFLFCFRFVFSVFIKFNACAKIHFLLIIHFITLRPPIRKCQRKKVSKWEKSLVKNRFILTNFSHQ